MIDDGWEAYQPRYVAYCLAHEASSPQEMLERDRQAYPGGKMGGYIIWISQKWREWLTLHGRRENDIKDYADHAEFDKWLIDGAVKRPPATSTAGAVKRPPATSTAQANYYFFSEGFENCLNPCLVKDDPNGGDPHILCEIKRIYSHDALHDLCSLANAALATPESLP